MSFFKATWWRPASALIVLTLAIAALSVGGQGTALAVVTDGSVTVTPNPLQIGAGGSGQLNVVLTPAAAGTSIWIIQIAYDPAVAQVATSSGNPVCTFITVTSPFVGAGGCDTKAVSHGTTQDTLVILGGVVQNDNGTPKGFTTPQTVATFTINANPSALVGAHSALTITVTSFLGPNGETPTPANPPGAIDIITQVGISRVWGDVDCSGAPVDIGDAINVERSIVSLPVTKPAGCPAIGDQVTITATGTWGDVDCSGAPVDIGDAINVERSIVSLPVTKPASCPAIGDIVQISAG